MLRAAHRLVRVNATAAATGAWELRFPFGLLAVPSPPWRELHAKRLRIRARRQKLLDVLGPVLLTRVRRFIKKFRTNIRSVKFYDNDPQLMNGAIYYIHQTRKGWYEWQTELDWMPR